MEGLVARARIAMLIMLLGAGALAWAAFEEKIDVLALGRLIANNSVWMKRDVLPEELKTYHRYILADDTPFFPDEIIRGMRVLDFFQLRQGLRYVDYEDLAEKNNTEAIEEFRTLRSAIDQLEALYSSSGVEENATMGRLSHKLKTTIQIPIVNKSVPAGRAFVAWTVAFLLIGFYMVSLMEAMRSRASVVVDEKGVDFVFLHPTWLGPVLGSLWLLSPAIAAILLSVRDIFHKVLGVGTAILLFILAVLLISRAIKVRRIFLKRLSTLDQKLH